MFFFVKCKSLHNIILFRFYMYFICVYFRLFPLTVNPFFIKVYYITVTLIYKLKYRLTRKTTHCLLLIGTFLRQPQIVEPFDNFHLQMIRHSPHPHVRLHAVQLRCNQQTIVFVTIYDLERQLDRKHVRMHIYVIFHSFCSTRLYFLI
jgi:hypothetical protein